MLFKEFGNISLPTIVLLHGGGLSYWSLLGVVDLLSTDYHVVTPIIDGHGEAGNETFVSIQDSADKLVTYIDNQHEGKVFAICGLSIGGQIVVEVLSKRSDIAQFAVLESALALPIKGVKAFTVPTYKLFYGLVKARWFSKLQAKTLFVPPNMFEQYYEDSLKISKQSLINITLSNGTYTLKGNLERTKARVLIVVGEKELGIMKKSAQILNDKIPNSVLYISQKMGHGELSLGYPPKYVEVIKKFFNEETS